MVRAKILFLNMHYDESKTVLYWKSLKTECDTKIGWWVCQDLSAEIIE